MTILGVIDEEWYECFFCKRATNDSTFYLFTKLDTLNHHASECLWVLANQLLHAQGGQ